MSSKEQTSRFHRTVRPRPLEALRGPGLTRLRDGRHVPTNRLVVGGRYNVYDCERGHSLLSLDLDDGVTPMLVACPFDATTAGSRGYRVHQPGDYLPVAMVWRRATPGELKRERRQSGDRGHYASGGLAREWVEKAAEHATW